MMKKRLVLLALLVLSLFLILVFVFFELGFFPAGRSLEKVLGELRTYEYGGHDEILLRLKNRVSDSSRDDSSRKECERQLLAFLESGATLTARMEVCRCLSIMGGEASVPVLERLIRADETSDMARYALERIPGGVADAAWLRLLSDAPDRVLPGVISSIGQAAAEMSREDSPGDHA